MTSPRLLLVEDEFLIRLMLSESLIEAGYEVLEASDADEALSRFGEGQAPAALLTDIQLPGQIDGRELARRVRQLVPELPVVFMTGRPDGDADGLARREITISKPYLPSEVCDAVGRLLAEVGGGAA